MSEAGIFGIVGERRRNLGAHIVASFAADVMQRCIWHWA